VKKRLSRTGTAKARPRRQTRGRQGDKVSDKLAFRLPDKYYAIDTANVYGIIEARDVYFLPGAKGSVRGVISLRGETVPVLDTSLLSGHAPKKRRAPGKVVVMEQEGRYLGIDLGGSEVFFIWDNEPEEEVAVAGSGQHQPGEREERFSGIETLSPTEEIEDVPCEVVFSLAEKMLSPGRRDVLIADDMEFYREAMRGILRSGGFTIVAEADNGEKAVRLASELHPSIVVLDIVMPIKNGLEAAAEIKALPNAPKVVICSSLIEEELKKEAQMAGAEAYITKPFTSAGDLDTLLDLSA